MRNVLENICDYLKSLIIAGIPNGFVVAERFRHDLTNNDIIKGVTAFRLYLIWQ